MGRAGQTKFGELCDLGKLVANDSSRADRMGWDYLIEVPLDAWRGEESFDSRHKVPDIKVQVKTIWADNDSVDVELLAAERLARWEYPSFIVVLRMNMDKTYRDGYIIHLFGDNLARILKALREAEAQNGRSIKNRTLTFNISAGTNIAIDGDELAKALREAIGNDGRNYAMRKRDQLDNLGYSVNKRVSGRFEIVAKDNDEVLNVFLGIQPGRATKIEADDIRFNIPIPLIRDTGGRIEIRPKSQGACQLVVSSVRDHKRAVFHAALYFASLRGPGAPWKLKVVSTLIELVASKESGKASFRIGLSEDGRYTLDEWALITQFYLITVSGSSTAVIRKQGKTLLAFDIKQHPWGWTPEYLKGRFDILIGLRDLMAEFGLQDLRLRDNEISENFDGINFILRAEKPNNSIVVTVSVKPLDKELALSGVREGLFASKIEFPGTTIAFWARMRISAHSEEGVIQLTCSEFVLRDIAIVDGDEALTAWVKEASEVSGLDSVIQVERVAFDDDSLHS